MHRLFDPLIDKSSNLGAGLDWKTSLQELTATEGLGVPEYLVTETGPDHEKTFTAAARVGGVSYGTGTGRSKKEAEQQAAESAWRSIRAAADERAEGGGRTGRPGRRRTVVRLRLTEHAHPSARPWALAPGRALASYTGS
ncbi:Ribonuclease 3 [Streptomyces alboniger]